MTNEIGGDFENPVFFQAYCRLRERVDSLNNLVEQPALLELIPTDLSNKVALDLGCGAGFLTKSLQERGASKVVGLDISRRMLDRAFERNRHQNIEYLQSNVETNDFGIEKVDLIVSSLAIHYIRGYRDLMHRLFLALKPGGKLVFSVEHPVYTCNNNCWFENEEGDQLHWPVDRYFEEGTRVVKWLDREVTKYHRTVETYIRGVLGAGFVLNTVLEPHPNDIITDRFPNLKSRQRRPNYILFSAGRP